MAKARTETETETKHAGTPFAFKVVRQIKVPTLKIEEGKDYFVHVTQPIETRQTRVQDPITKMDVLKDIDIIRCVNLETGEVVEMVGSAAVSSTLKDYDGGNAKYVGKSFRLRKGANAPGKRYKLWQIDEIEAE